MHKLHEAVADLQLIRGGDGVDPACAAQEGRGEVDGDLEAEDHHDEEEEEVHDDEEEEVLDDEEDLQAVHAVVHAVVVALVGGGVGHEVVEDCASFLSCWFCLMVRRSVLGIGIASELIYIV